MTTADWDKVLDEHLRVAEALRAQRERLERMAEIMIDCLRNGGRIYVFGNGGSAADAQHIAAELVGRFKHERQALPVVALTTDTSTLTAVANDTHFDQVFARQIAAFAAPGDIAWAISTSGNSPNILSAVDVAHERGATVIGFTGRGGGALAERCDHVLRVPHDASDRIQEGHELAYHYLCQRIEAALLGQPAAPAAIASAKGSDHGRSPG